MMAIELDTLATVGGGVDWRAVRQAAVGGAMFGAPSGAMIGAVSGAGLFSAPGALVGAVIGGGIGAISSAVAVASFDHFVPPVIR